jgi:hypothetical protein
MMTRLAILVGFFLVIQGVAFVINYLGQEQLIPGYLVVPGILVFDLIVSLILDS